MNIVLIYPPDETQAQMGAGRELFHKLEPLGLLYVAALTRSKGHDVSVIDAYAESLDCGEIQKRLLAARPDILGPRTVPVPVVNGQPTPVAAQSAPAPQPAPVAPPPAQQTAAAPPAGMPFAPQVD